MVTGFIAILSLAIPCRAGNADAAPPIDVGALLEQLNARDHIPATAALVVRGHDVIGEGAAGVRKLGAPVRVSLQDQFEICSCAKSMTAALAAMIIDEGRLRWDSTLGEILGGAITGMHSGWRRVTLRELLDHRSGLAADPLVLFLTRTALSTASLPRQRLDCTEKILQRRPDFTPGTRWAYVSANYVIAVAMIERVTGRAWEDLILERLFQPLGMTTAGFGPPDAGTALTQPWGHGYRFFFPVPGFRRTDAPVPPHSVFADPPLAAAPAGLVHVTMRDWAKFVAFELRTDPGNPHRETMLLQPATRAMLSQPVTTVTVPKSLAGGICTCGWLRNDVPWAKGNHIGDTGRLLWFQGDNGRWNTSAWIAPEIDLALIVACNRGGTWNHCSQVARALVDKFAGSPGLPGSTLDGRWTGSLTPLMVDDHRVALEISSAGGTNRRANVFDLRESPADPVPITKLTEHDDMVHLETSKGGICDARLNGDKSELSGVWTQGGRTLQVIFKRAASLPPVTQ